MIEKQDIKLIADPVLLTITIICYHYVKHRSKQKGINALTRQNGK